MAMLLGLFLAASASLALADPDGTIRGQVGSGTGDGGPVAGVEVELLTLLHRQGPPVITTTTSDEDGQFTFENVDSDPQNAHVLRVTYAGQTYFSELITFDQDNKSLDVPLVVYETTQDGSKIAVRRAHAIIEFEGNQVFVALLYFIDNLGDRTFVGNEDRNTLHFTLPPDASELGFQDTTLSQHVVQEKDGFRLSQALTPGETQLVFSYALPYHHPRQSLAFTMTYDVPDLVLLVSDVGQQVEAPGLTVQGQRQAQDTSYYTFAGADFQAGQVVRVNFENLPPPQTAVPSSAAPPSAQTQRAQGLADTLPWWTGLVMLLIGIGAAGAYAITQTSPASAMSRPQALRRERDGLVRQIVQLEDRFETGRIGQSAFRKQRAALKQRLLRALRELRRP